MIMKKIILKWIGFLMIFGVLFLNSCSEDNYFDPLNNYSDNGKDEGIEDDQKDPDENRPYNEDSLMLIKDKIYNINKPVQEIP